MLSGKLLGISTADCGLLSFADGELVYITRRFDRNDGDSKLHQEDLVQGFRFAHLPHRSRNAIGVATVVTTAMMTIAENRP